MLDMPLALTVHLDIIVSSSESSLNICFS